MDPNQMNMAVEQTTNNFQFVWAYGGASIIGLILTALTKNALWESGMKIIKDEASKGDCSLCRIGQQVGNNTVRGTLLLAFVWNELRTIMFWEGIIYSVIFGLLALIYNGAVKANEASTIVLTGVFGFVMFALLIFYIMRLVLIWYCLTVANR